MLPKNIADRRKAFYNFLILFLVSIVIIIATVFFSIWVPFKQNDQLRSQIDEVQKEQDFSKNFYNGMFAIYGMLDSINTNKTTNPDILDGNITASITKLNVLVESNSVYNKPLYENVVLTLAALQASEKQIRSLTSDKTNTVRSLTSQNQTLNTQLSLAADRFQKIQQLVSTYQSQVPQDFYTQISTQLQSPQSPQ